MSKKKQKASVWGYMVEESTVAAWLDHFWNDGWSRGYDKGKLHSAQEAFRDGFSKGRAKGFHAGHERGCEEKSAAYDIGWRTGFESGRELEQRNRREAEQLRRAALGVTSGELGWICFVCLLVIWIISTWVVPYV